jgi:GNAT superfamily N-acetyltransferase
MDGQSRRRFSVKMVAMRIKIVENDRRLAEIALAAVPEIRLRRPLDEKLAGRAPLYLAAVVDGRAAGFKIGYPLSETVFYSWLGGVAPEFRCAGVAAALLAHQERWAAAHGYREMQVKSMNRFPGMLRLLIKNGYRITGVEGSEPVEMKICFAKQLI